MSKAKSVKKMTTDGLIAEARENRTGPSDPEMLKDMALLAWALRFSLDQLLSAIDYEREQAAGAAVAARAIAAMILMAEDLKRNRLHA